MGCGHRAWGRRGLPISVEPYASGGDAREIYLFQDIRVGGSVLPADVEKIAEVSEVEMVQSFFMPTVRGRGFLAVE